jgi:hypothetical protein
LALRDILLQRQALTATHDQSTAWTGLGSALLVVWRQFRIPASVFGTLLISIYLIGISILHISTPSLFHLQIFDQPNATTISTKIGMPVINFDAKYNSLRCPSDLQLTTFLTSDPLYGSSYWSDIGSLLPYLGRADSNNTIGVQNATLYDILDDNNGTGTVAVGAKSFSVTCGLIPNSTVTGTPSNQPTTWLVEMINDWSFTLNPIGEQDSLSTKCPLIVLLAAPNVLGNGGLVFAQLNVLVSG